MKGSGSDSLHGRTRSCGLRYHHGLEYMYHFCKNFGCVEMKRLQGYTIDNAMTGERHWESSFAYLGLDGVNIGGCCRL